MQYSLVQKYSYNPNMIGLQITYKSLTTHKKVNQSIKMYAMEEVIQKV